MAVSDSDRDPIELLASEFLARYRRREQPTVEEYVERHPELADEIRDAFATLLAMEGLKQKKESDSAGGRVTLGARQLKQLGDFRIEREIGRGGMGIVYEAIQESLHRRVALKVLPHAHFDERRVARFQREALTAANLSHPNIVPVFGVGEQDGIHYYVMQCIDGVGLDASLAQAVTRPQAVTIHRQETVAVGIGETDRLPPTGTAPPPRTKDGNAAAALIDGKTGLPLFREIARIGRQAATALDYAHKQGVLHRDIKPSNLILDARGNIWIADFGLAKAMESSNLSQTGELAGTLRYMAPERFQGESEPRSDVYSLGMTLYELLTRRPAFAAAQGQQLIDQITRGEPAAPRKVMPQIPHDLETIVLKAIAREPKRRYRTAGDLADDLERWLTFRPIHARRVSPPEQAWMWARRNPTVAGLSALVCVLLGILLAMGGYDYWKTKQDATTASRQLVVSEEQRRKAEDTSERVMAALNGICDELALASESAQAPPLSREEAAALETLLPLQQQLAASTDASPEVQRDAAMATRRVADIFRMLGRYQDAISTYGQARHKYLALERPPRSATLDLEIASLDNDLGTTLRMMQRGPEAEVSYGRALELLEPLAGSERTATDDVRYQLARTYYLLAQPPGLEAGPPPPPHDLRGAQDAGGRGRPPGGMPAGPPNGPPGGRLGGPPGGRPEGGRPSGPPRRGPPPGPGRRGPGPPPGPPSGPFGPIGGPLSEDGRQRPGPDKHNGGLTDEQFEWFAQAIALLEALHEAHPQQADYRHLLACAYRDQSRGRVPHDAERQLKQAEDLLVELVNEYPDVAAYRLDLMAAYVANEFADLSALRKALNLSNEFVQRYRQVPIYTVERVSILFRLGMMLHRDAHDAEAEASLREALELVGPLVEKFPDVTTYKLWQSAGRMSLALILHHQGDDEQARVLLEQTISSLEELPAGDGDDPASGMLRDAQGILDLVLSDAGEPM